MSDYSKIILGKRKMTSKINIAVIDSDDDIREVIKKKISLDEDVEISGEFNNIIDGCNFIFERKPQIIIMDISQNTKETLDSISKIHSVLKNSKIIVLSRDMHPELVVKSLRAGAVDFVIKSPLNISELVDIIQKAKKGLNLNVDYTTKCKVISVFSNKGGIGKTSIAVNLAYELANLTKESVALIDLNMQMGDVTTFLDLNPAFNTSYIIKNLEKIDEKSILSSLEKYKSTSLYVLADPPNLEQAENIKAKDITKLINILKNVFSYIVIDTTSSFDEKTVMSLENSDLVLLPVILNIPSLRNCQRCFDLFKKSEYHEDKIKVIINRFMKNDELKIEDAQRLLNRNIYYTIPNDYGTIISAINQGLPLSEVNFNSDITKSFKDLANLLADNFVYETLEGGENKEPSRLMKLFNNKK